MTVSRRAVWTAAFLAVTAFAVGMELYAIRDGDERTDPWTYLIVDHLPESVTVAAVAALTAWLGPHLADARRKRHPGGAVDPIPVPPSREADARNRGWRTLVAGWGVDIAIALILFVGPALVGSDLAWTPTYWKAVGLLAASTVIKATVSYFARKLIPPEFSPPREVREVTPVPTATTTPRADKTPL